MLSDSWTPDKGIIDITEGKTVYTKDGATIQYKSDEDGAEWKTMIIS